jgi:hypothetical protein
MKILLSFLLAGALLSGCADWDKSKDFYGGYSVTKLGENIFKVSIQENEYIHKQGEPDFALLYSSSVTIRNGFRYFIVVKSNEDANEDSSDGGQSYVTKIPSRINTIICFKERPNIIGLIYDAKFISESLKLKY